MSVLSRVRAVQAILIAAVGARALLWGASAWLGVMVGAVIVDVITPISLAIRAAVIVVAAMAGSGVAAAMMLRDRRAASLPRVALWIEEQFPSLEFALVTAIELGEVDRSAVVRSTAAAWPVAARRRSLRAVALPLGAAILAIVMLALLPAGAVGRVRSPHAGDALDSPALSRRAALNRLSPLVADITPPRYTGQASSSLDDPISIRAVVGSAIVLRGREGWRRPARMPATPQALRLADRGFERIVALEPIVDAAPSVTLFQPARDTVLRFPVSGRRLSLNAQITDDFGIASAAFEYIVSSGEGETFTFRSGTLGAAKPSGRNATIDATLALDALALEPGDVVHLRAVARDANDVTGPGSGTSETRVIRIARAGEYDSLAVEAAPPGEPAKDAISQRMLIMLAEALEKRRPTLARPSVVAESRSIASDQRRLRKLVGDLVFSRLGAATGEESTDADVPARARSMEELLKRADSVTNRSRDEPIDFAGGESPVVAVNRPLLEAYNAMWEAGTQLELGEPNLALPHMRRALAAVQRARAAERIYLRGRPPQVVIDISKVRLQGKTKGSSSVRMPRAATDSAVWLREERFARAVELAMHDAGAAVDSLLLVRIEAIQTNPGFAAAVGVAIDALRAGKADAATNALAHARRALAGPAVVSDSLARWSALP